jgi:hypothetical protein
VGAVVGAGLFWRRKRIRQRMLVSPPSTPKSAVSQTDIELAKGRGDEFGGGNREFVRSAGGYEVPA